MGTHVPVGSHSGTSASEPVAASAVASTVASAVASAVASGTASATPSDRAMRAELDRRITEFACYSDSTFGPLSALDLILTFALFIVLPLVVVWVSR